MMAIVNSSDFLKWLKTNQSSLLQTILHDENYKESILTTSSSYNLNKLIVGNTLVVVNRFGPTLIHFSENGLFKQIGQEGQSSVGTWRVADGNLCFIVTSVPLGVELKEYCLDMGERSFDSSWMK